MPSPLAPHRLIPGAFALLLLLAAGDDGKKGCSCKPDPVDPDGDLDTEVVAAVETALQVVSIDPSRVPAGQATEATLYGSAFAPGATVHVGSVAASGVRVVNQGALELTVPALGAGTYDVEVRLASGESATLRRGLSVQEAVAQCGSLTVRFGFDRDELTPEARAAVDGNVSCYTGRTDGIRVEGHADERGTTDYNLALGQRRADSVKRYLIGKGVEASRVATVSFGEERPADPGHSEAAWSANRRAEIHVGR